KSEGVNLAMSCICPLATIATLIVLALVLPIAVAASEATATSPMTRIPTSTLMERCSLRLRGSCKGDPLLSRVMAANPATSVSPVVNDEPGVSPALEAKVRRAIAQLNYRRDANASMLRRLGSKTQTIGLVLEDVANPFSSALHRAIEDTARARGVLVFAGSCDENPLRERELIGSFRDRRVDGIIVVPASEDHTYLYGEQRAGTALVFLDRPAGHL